jgi:glutamine synthetase
MEFSKPKTVSTIMLQFVDLRGESHSLWVSKERFEKIKEKGIHVDGSSIDMVSIEKSDLKLLPDLSTFRILPSSLFQQEVGYVVCDLYQAETSTPLEEGPRRVLQKVIETLLSQYQYYTSVEVEYFLLKKEESSYSFFDQGSYLSLPPLDLGVPLRLEIIQTLNSMGIEVEKHHHEVPPGKYELNLKYKPAIEMCDLLYLVKFVIKQLALKYNLIATFMPKPFHQQYGAGLHTHVSIMKEEGENLFYKKNSPYGISEMGLNFIAGILHHARGLTALTNPTVNSYKRLVPGWEAPVYISWAKYNRSVLVRIPPGKAERTRIEYRPTDGGANFYLALAGILVAGMDGVLKKIKLPPPTEENIYEIPVKKLISRGIKLLPSTLGEALAEFQKDKVLWKGLGESVCKHYLQLKEKEWQEFNQVVHKWEQDRYLKL